MISTTSTWKTNPLSTMQKNSAAVKYLQHVQNEFLCPISLEVMTKPVVAADGFSYEKKNIERWFRTSKRSPMTNLRLKNRTVIPNIALRKLIETHAHFKIHSMKTEYIQNTCTNDRKNVLKQACRASQKRRCNS